jgi:hypothetical protein
MAVESDWVKSIIPHIDSAPQSRLSVHSPLRRHLLALPTPEQSRELIGLWRAQLDPPVRPAPWPFSDTSLDALCHQPGLTPRMLLQAFQEALVSGETLPVDGVVVAEPPAPGVEELADTLEESLRSTWDQHCAQARASIQEADEEERGVSFDILLDALTALGVVDPGLGVRRVETEARASQGGRGIVLVHSPNGISVAAQLKKLRERIGSGGQLLAVRERWRPVPDSWKVAAEQRKALESALAWRWLERDEVERYLALRSLLMSARSHDVSGPDGKALDEATVIGWLRQQDCLRDDPLVLWWQDRAAQLPTPAPPLASGPQEAPVPTPSPPAVTPAPPPSAVTPPPSAVTPAPPSVSVEPGGSPLLAALRRLRVASAQRLARELSTRERTWRPAEVLREVRKIERQARVIGTSLVVLRDEQEGA